MSLDIQLLEAIESRNTGEVRSLLAQGANANTETEEGINVIFLAIENNDKNIVQLLIEHGADVNAKNPQEVSAISFAITHNCQDIVRLLIDHGANINGQFSITECGNICTYTSVTSVFVNGLHEGNIRDVRDILELLLKAGANPDTTFTCKNENNNNITVVSVLRSTNPEILFLFLTFGAKLKDEDLAIIKENSDLQNCLTAFEQISTSHLGKLIEANIKKEGAKTIVSYINNKAEGQKLIEEFKTIKERYGSDGRLSFISEDLSSNIKHLCEQYLLEHKKDAFKTGALAGIIEAAVFEKQKKDISLMNDLEIKDYGISDQDMPNLRLACKGANDDASACYKKYEVKAESLLTQLKRIEPLAELQHMEI